MRQRFQPQAEPEPRTLLSKDQIAEVFLRGRGWDETWDAEAVIEDIQRLSRMQRATGSLDIERTLRFWRALRARRYPHTLLRSSVQITHVEHFRPDDPGTPDA